MGIFTDTIDRFCAGLARAGRSSYTIVAYRKDLDQFSEYLKAHAVEAPKDITKENVEGFISSLFTSKGYTKKSASRKLNSVRTFFRFLKNEGLIETNPTTEISHPKYELAAPRILTKLEYRGLRDVAKSDPRTYAIVEVLLQTGMKIGELSTLGLDDVGEDSLFVRAQSGQGRSIPLNKAASQALKEYIKVRPPFPNKEIFITRTGRPMLVRNIRQIINRCFVEVGIESATVNDLRNTFIAHQLTNGAGLEYIAKIVGHKRLSSTERFLDLVKQEAERRDRLGEL